MTGKIFCPRCNSDNVHIVDEGLSSYVLGCFHCGKNFIANTKPKVAAYMSDEELLQPFLQAPGEWLSTAQVKVFFGMGKDRELRQRLNDMVTQNILEQGRTFGADTMERVYYRVDSKLARLYRKG